MDNTTPLTNMTAGKILKTRREELNIPLEQASIDTKIQKRYLIQIEEDQFTKFDSPVFVAGFIKIYSAYLGLNVDKVLALYRRTDKESQTKKPKMLQQRLNKFDFREYVTPRNALILVLVTVVGAILLYLGIQYNNFQKPPTLSIESPRNNTKTSEESISLVGSIEADSILEIDGERINIGESTDFEHKVNLNIGTNNITVKAIKESNTNRETIIILTVVREEPETEAEPEPEQPEVVEETTNREVTLTIANDATWILLSIDGVQQVAQALEAGYSETFTFENEIFISSGKPNNTSLIFNGSPVTLPITPGVGTISTTCTLADNQLLCR